MKLTYKILENFSTPFYGRQICQNIDFGAHGNFTLKRKKGSVKFSQFLYISIIFGYTPMVKF